MSLADRIGSLNGEMHRQQIEVLQQYCRDLEKENTYYRNRLKVECTKHEEAQYSLVEDWFFVKKELYNFITFTRAMTTTQAKESPLLKNIVRFDRRITEFISLCETSHAEERQKVSRRNKPSYGSFQRERMEPAPVSSEDVAQDTLQEILNLW